MFIIVEKLDISWDTDVCFGLWIVINEINPCFQLFVKEHLKIVNSPSLLPTHKR